MSLRLNVRAIFGDRPHARQATVTVAGVGPVLLSLRAKVYNNRNPKKMYVHAKLVGPANVSSCHAAIHDASGNAVQEKSEIQKGAGEWVLIGTLDHPHAITSAEGEWTAAAVEWLSQYTIHITDVVVDEG